MKKHSVRLTFLVAVAMMLVVATPRGFAQIALPGLSLSGAANAFPEQSVGTQSNVYTVTLSNGENTAVSLTYSGANPNYPVLSDTCGAELASGDSCQIQWDFSPQAAGYAELDYGISATDSISGDPVVIYYNGESVGGVTLSGTGIKGAVSLRTDGHNFGPWVVGTTSNAYLTILSNTTPEMVNLSYAKSGNFKMFPQMANTCGATLLAGASCSLEWEFSPAATGALGTTYGITAIDACGCNPVSITAGTQTVPGVTLTGNGQADAQLSLATAGHNFGQQSVGSSSATYGTVLYNTTGVTVNLSVLSSNFGAAANFNSVANDCGLTLATNTSCNMQWQFSPVTTGAISDVFEIGARYAGLPMTITTGGNPVNGVTLSGTGTSSNVKK